MKKKVYLPAWQKKFIPPLFFLIWVFTTYKNFFGESKGEMSTTEYLLMTVVFIGAGVVIWLMASGKLPAYIINDESDREEH